MTTGVQRRRGTTAQHSTFTGLEGEITVDTTKDTAVVHDGSTVGGHPLARQDLSNVDPTALSALTGVGTASGDLFLIYDVSTNSLKKITRDELNNAIEQDALANVTITGGSINGTTVGASTASTGAFTTLSASSTVSGSGFSTYLASPPAIGSGTASTGAFTSLSASGAFSANGGATLGDASGDALTINSSAVSIPNGLNFDSNTLVIDATNNRVGVGTASPSTRLHVDGSGVAATFNRTDNVAVISLQYNGTQGGYLGTAGTGITTFYDNTGSERMRITSTGNVGIGTSSPSTTLQLGDTAKASDTLVYAITANGAYKSGVVYQVSGVASGFVGYNNSGSTYNAIPTGAAGFSVSGANPIVLATNNAERMRLDSSGNLGLGVTPSAWGSLGASRAIQLTKGALSSLSGGPNDYIAVSSNSYADTSSDPASAVWRYVATGTATLYEGGRSGQHRFYTAASGTAGNAITFTQAMTLDASGNLLVGTTTAVSTVNTTFGLTAYGQGTIAQYTSADTNSWGRSNNGNVHVFRQGTTIVGNINITASATAYVTSSDYRLKENIAPMTGALATVAQLKPVTYNWKVDGSEGQGFIAHELQAVVPDCVTGEKDAVDAEGKPVYQGIDTSFLVATLTASIQELKAIVDAQAERIAVLESK